MKNLLNSYKINFSNRQFLIEASLSLLMLLCSLFVNFYAGVYATKIASNSVTDIILSNIRVFDVDGIFVYGGLAIFLIIAVFCLIEPKKLPFIVKSISLFVLIRALFISLTHIAPFPTQVIVISTNFANHFMFSGDLFFSGHTGLPFLMALIYWDKKIIRYFFLFLSIFFGIIVLLGHLHYSIDVFSAFFITYSIYKISEYIFKKDYIISNA